jgi:polysaccharide export outer membrane protein
VARRAHAWQGAVAGPDQGNHDPYPVRPISNDGCAAADKSSVRQHLAERRDWTRPLLPWHTYTRAVALNVSGDASKSQIFRLQRGGPPAGCRPFATVKSGHSVRFRFSFLPLAAIAASVLSGSISPASAQQPTQPPTQQQPSPRTGSLLTVMEQRNADLLARVRAAIARSGFSPDQIRLKLREQAYAPTLLDGVMSEAEDVVVTPEILEALEAIGIVKPADLEAKDSTAVPRDRSRVLAPEDSVLLDSVADLLQADDSARAALKHFLRSRELQRTLSDSGFQVFGLDVFTRDSTGFAPDLGGPVSDDYRIGIGDRLTLTLTGDVESTTELLVNREGFVVVPRVPRPLYVANLTKAEADRLVFDALSRVYSGINRSLGATTRMLLTMTNVGTKLVYVTGDVMKPGGYSIPNSGTMFTALYQAGGPTEKGSMRRVELKRSGRTVGVLDAYDYLIGGNRSADAHVNNGDVVFVPPRGGHVRITGAILRPATYEIKPGETVTDAIRMAGGMSPFADGRRVQFERYLPLTERAEAGRDRQVFDVVSTNASGAFPVIELQPGDLVRVPEGANRLTGFITIKGNVWKPGRLAATPGMKLSAALRLAGGIKPDTYLEQVNISRLLSDSTRQMLRAGLRDTLGNIEEDIEVREFDEIAVYSRTDFRPMRYVAIGGAVKRGGRIPFREGMSMRDLILEAGGLVESAWLTEAEIARLADERTGNTLATTMRVRLDSTYLFERGADGSYQGPPGLPAPSSGAPEVYLRPYDNVTIMHQPNWSLTEVVSIQGQVRFPAVYALTRKDERISDIVRRAGGLTTEAYANGVVFVRKRGRVGRVGIDLPKILRNPRDPDNLPLVDGDSIFVPKYVGIVTVRGRVNSPVGVAYERGKDIDYYIRAAGGGTSDADQGRAFVTQPNGKVESKDRHLWVYVSNPDPQPGSTVEVPVRSAPRRDIVSTSAAVVTTLGTLVTTIAVIKSLGLF